ncbi:glycerol 3-phosphate dehydrogenase (NAD(P)+) [Anseongella ginsenosidimutans]|uniref:Glycerol-3-phosphate dehydrogenase n=1 Tax=Anseongella ginsenosidimutans TaxID=496056 RepID=A0A4R3KT35_9SPHI|nr:NAD(P)H-dependent glycerol-3-phosphate dehydrogenase [Anseongella ginsenosidimutans]TCS88157.1 glycerol 3-phosphate dehydrogenase (NAD(P)+) [Anseongella ginsenosidimutans]
MNKFHRITISGGGSWATALTKIFAESGVHVCWHLRSDAHVEQIREKGRNPNYLSYLELPMENIHPVSDFEEAARAADHILFAIPSAYLEASLGKTDPELLQDKKVIVSIKGVVTSDNLLPTDYLSQRFQLEDSSLAVIGGPCHAEEIAMERKTYVTVASRNNELAETVAGSITSHYIRTVINNDPLGVEYSAILKNVIGIACGIAHGLNYGDNFQAVIVSNALREIKHFLEIMHPLERDLSQSAYFGDLLVTAYSEFSRNRTFGHMIGRGYTVQLAHMQMNMVAEGYFAVKGIYDMSRQIGLEMPLVSAVYRILYNHISPYIEFKLLENKLI